jgi:hypothetical protein
MDGQTDKKNSHIKNMINFVTINDGTAGDSVCVVYVQYTFDPNPVV